MTSISHVDQAIIVLRERLRQLRGDNPAPSPAVGRATAGGSRPISRMRSLANIQGLPQAEIRKALVRTLLAEALGEHLANDVSFVAIADRVTQMLEESEDGRTLIDQALEDVRKSTSSSGA